MIHLSELLVMLGMEPVDDTEGKDVLIPLEVAEQIKQESLKKQSLIVQGLLELKYNPMAKAEEVEEGLYALNVDAK